MASSRRDHALNRRRLQQRGAPTGHKPGSHPLRAAGASIPRLGRRGRRRSRWPRELSLRPRLLLLVVASVVPLICLERGSRILRLRERPAERLRRTSGDGPRHCRGGGAGIAASRVGVGNPGHVADPASRRSGPVRQGGQGLPGSAAARLDAGPRRPGPATLAGLRITGGSGRIAAPSQRQRRRPAGVRHRSSHRHRYVFRPAQWSKRIQCRCSRLP